jgi:hypothetical protein
MNKMKNYFSVYETIYLISYHLLFIHQCFKLLMDLVRFTKLYFTKLIIEYFTLEIFLLNHHFHYQVTNHLFIITIIITNKNFLEIC